MPDLREQLAQIYVKHAASVYRRALALLGSDTDAREVLQDLFVTLLERPEQFEGRSKLSTYLYSATTNACLNRLRNQRTRVRLLRDLDQARPDIAPGFEAGVRVREALRRLPSPLAEVAVYQYVDGLSQQEIAELLGCSRRHVADLVAQLAAWGRAQEAACSTA